MQSNGAGARKVAVVTGGMSDLGEAICQRLSTSGFQVVVTYSPAYDNARLWLDTQESAGFDFTATMLDVADFVSCQAGIGNILADVGRIDVLVNNAGIIRDVTLEKMTVQDWRKVVRSNLDSVFNVTKQVLGNMLEREWGRIINFSSIVGQGGEIGQTGYAASAAAIHGFTKSLALEVARKGITVNTVSPGYLQTTTGAPREVLEKKILPRIPIGRLGEPREVAGLVAYLASRDAAFVTGANIAINGGQHMD
jgi:acetoacetyl-CoA reductase